jgi:ATP-dependent DNA helicase RecG
LAGAAGRRRAYARVAERVAAGERAFVVCPLVEPSPDDETRRDWADATSMASALAKELAPARVALAHGRMPQAERQAAMARFGDGDADVLVATTVVEVGVDVPAATVMVIEDAQSFGLAQLHQLRGRVGRGGGASWCLLLSRGRGTDAARRRLEVMAETTDGFRIAEEDLALRGPGELLGVRQAGLPKLRFGDLREHTELLVLARQEADRVIAADPELSAPEHRATRLVLAMRAGDGEAVAYGAEGG